MSDEGGLVAELEALRGRLGQLEMRIRRSLPKPRAIGSAVEVLFVEVGPLAAAFELESVVEVVPAAALAPIPEAPLWVMGSLNLRGISIPVASVHARFSPVTPELRLSDLIVVVSTDSGMAGLVVSAVGAIQTVELGTDISLQETPHAPYVVGTLTFGGTARLLLGVRELLQHSDVATLLSPVAAKSDVSRTTEEARS